MRQAFPNYPFEGLVALVTGAASGMGLATARAFAEWGASVVLADFDEDAVERATAEIVSAGHEAIAVRCDVSDDAQVEAMVERAVSAFGRLDSAFNTAGVMARIAPRMPTTMSPARPKPVPWTSRPASQPAMPPTTQVTISAASMFPPLSLIVTAF